MAIYHFNNKYISRGAGQSAVAAAAYQSRSSLYNERDGLQKNYERHGTQELLYSAIYTPQNAPEWTHDREQLWNEVEAAEDKHNKTRKAAAITAQHIELALPHELTLEENRRLVVDFVRDNFTRKGYVADINIHSPDERGDERNIHAHILLTMRKIEGDEFSKEKGHKDRAELREDVTKWREKWAHQQARHLERAGFQMEAERVRYSHLTLEQQKEIAKERGDKEHAAALDREATKHEGATITQMKREGKSAEIIDFNQAAADRAERIRRYEVERDELEKESAAVFYMNTSAGKMARLERIQEWQTDRLDLQHERETAKLAAKHEWERHTTKDEVIFIKMLRERERERESASLDVKQDAERQELETKQREARDKLASAELWKQHEAELNQKREQRRADREKRQRLRGQILSPHEILERGRQAIAEAQAANAAEQGTATPPRSKERDREEEQDEADRRRQDQALKDMVRQNSTKQSLSYTEGKRIEAHQTLDYTDEGEQIRRHGTAPAPEWTLKVGYTALSDEEKEQAWNAYADSKLSEKRSFQDYVEMRQGMHRAAQARHESRDGGNQSGENGSDDRARFVPAWMRKEGGLSSLNEAETKEARGKFDDWTQRREQDAEQRGKKAKAYSFGDYVEYVQKKEAERREEARDVSDMANHAQNGHLHENAPEARPAAPPMTEAERMDRRDEAAARFEERERQGIEARETIKNERQRNVADQAEQSAWWKAAQAQVNQTRSAPPPKTEEEQKRFDSFLSKLKRQPAPEPPPEKTEAELEREAAQREAQRKAEAKERQKQRLYKMMIEDNERQCRDRGNDYENEYEP